MYNTHEVPVGRDHKCKGQVCQMLICLRYLNMNLSISKDTSSLMSNYFPFMNRGVLGDKYGKCVIMQMARLRNLLTRSIFWT